jgi:succinate dehydrogenase / fumarate reductase cytochrome b subunit
MLAFILHRISGLGIIVFVGAHVFFSFGTQQIADADWATNLNILYMSVPVQILVAFFVIFHSINGMRIALMDLWPKSLIYQREALWLQWFAILPIFGLTAFVLITNSLSGG